MFDPPPPFTARTCFWSLSASEVYGYTQRSQDIDCIFLVRGLKGFVFAGWVEEEENGKSILVACASLWVYLQG